MISETEYQKITEYIEKYLEQYFAVTQELLSDTAHDDSDSVMFNDFLHLGVNTVAVQVFDTYPDYLRRALALTNGRSRPNTAAFYRWLSMKPELSEDFTELLIRVLSEKGYKNNYPDFYRKAEIDRRLFSKIVSEAYEYHPDIKTVFKLIIGLELQIDEATQMLNTAAYDFGTIPFNLVIRYCIENRIYHHEQIDQYLFAICNQTLYSLD